jgi:hypothetical protein
MHTDVNKKIRGREQCFLILAEYCSLPRAFIDLYGGESIDGYQLVRLKDELKNAQIDAEARAKKWKVLTGWDGERHSSETETRKEADRGEVLSILESINSMIDECKKNCLVLVCSVN